MTPNEFFSGNTPVFTAEAPGRLDVMGGIADYSGSLVLEMPIAETCIARVSLRRDGALRCYSADAVLPGETPLIELTLGEAGSVAALVSRLKSGTGAEWAGYALGCVAILNDEHQAEILGADIHIESSVPVGKGVSSSAALEVATMLALSRACEVELADLELPILCQKVEQQVVGAPCGLMDQLTCYLGKAGMLLPIFCQTNDVGDPVAIPDGIEFTGIDSGVRHAVSGASYTDVRCAAFMGYRIILGSVNADPSGDPAGWPGGGALSGIEPEVFLAKFRSILPESMCGQEFIDRYGETTDPVTRVEPDRIYYPRDCASHPVFEHNRVNRFMCAMQECRANEGIDEAPLCEMGELMVESHRSYSVCGLGSEATDYIVGRASEFGAGEGVYGAKITGGGSGGTVCVLHRGEKGLAAVRQIRYDLGVKYGFDPACFSASSDGARWR